MRNNSKPKTLVVAGDVTMDWNIAHTQHLSPDGKLWNADDRTRPCWLRGGAALLADLVQAVASDVHGKTKINWKVLQSNAPRKAILPGDPQYNDSYAMWSLYDKNKVEDRGKAWRVRNFLGLDRKRTTKPQEWEKVVNDTGDADIVVLDDANLGFREMRELWPKATTTAGTKPWVVVKMARPVADGNLWNHLRTNHADRLIVVMTINDLRLNDVYISRELSWERTAQELAWELQFNPNINSLSECAHVVVSFDTAGAFVLSRRTSDTKNNDHMSSKLLFDPEMMEGMWAESHPGGMVGYGTCLTAGIVRHLMLKQESADIAEAITSGLSAQRRLHLEGYGVHDTVAIEAGLTFPFDAVVKELSHPTASFSVVDVEEQPSAPSQAGSSSDSWSILEDQYTIRLKETSQLIVREGAMNAIHGVPIGRFGAFVTVDRREIESFHSIRRLIREYWRAGNNSRPLSIAVFGPPGSGKSFGVTEVAKSVLPGQVKILSFNLSQFNDPDDLEGAFHQVRDAAIGGFIPLVFWDEFDTSLAGVSLGWLRYFLAPMQDGSFLQGQVTHPLGRSIFVFAGGTSHSIEEFQESVSKPEAANTKGRDFISRLKGYVNVLGPNKQGEDDRYYLVRRAMLLRSILERNAKHLCAKGNDGKTIIEMDKGLLRALLETREYKHGARSMESVVAMSLLSGKSTFERSSLPSLEQLNLHVDAMDFQSLMYSPILEGELLEKLSEGVHEVFCAMLRQRGYTWGEVTDDARRKHSSLKPYAKLPEHEQDQNRDNARDIPAKLAQVGFAMVPLVHGKSADQLTKKEIESLAEQEHDRWVRLKLKSGWRWGRKTDKPKKLHKDLVPWQKLSLNERQERYQGFDVGSLGPGVLQEKEKEKDRELVKGIPKILEKAGFGMVRIHEKKS